MGPAERGFAYRCYNRFRAWYVIGMLGYYLLITAGGGTGITIGLLRLLGRDNRSLPFAVGVVVASIVVVVAVGLVVLRDDLMMTLRWVAHRDIHDAEAAHALAINVSHRAIRFGTLLAPPTEVIATLIIVHHLHEPVRVWPLAVLVVELGVALFLVVGYFTGTAAFRPIAVEAAQCVDRASLQIQPLQTVRARTVLALTFTGVCSAFVAYVIGPIGHSGPERLWIALGIASLIDVAFIVFIIHGVTESFTAPLDDLTRWTQRVSSGDLSRSVPVTTADELGKIAATFNEMLVGLREHEALRKRSDELNRDLQRALLEFKSAQARLISVADSERLNMEQAIHVGAQQSLVVLSLKLARLRTVVGTDPKEAGTLLDEVRADAQAGLDQLRDLAHGIYPASLASDGLEPALWECAARSTVPITFELALKRRLPADIETALYFCCASAFDVIQRSDSGAESVRVWVSEDDAVLTFSLLASGKLGGAGDLSRLVQTMTDRFGAVGGRLRGQMSGIHFSVAGSIPVDEATGEPAGSPSPLEQPIEQGPIADAEHSWRLTPTSPLYGRMRDRLGHWYPPANLVIAFFVSMFAATTTVWVVLRFIHHTQAAFVHLAIEADATALVGGLIVAWIIRKEMGVLWRWEMDGPVPERARECWEAAIFVSRKVLIYPALVVGLTVPAFIIEFKVREGLPWTAVPAMIAGVEVGVLLFSAYLFFKSIALGRLYAAEAAGFLSERPPAKPAVMSVRRRTLLAVSLTTVFGALEASAIGPIGHPGAGRLLGALLVSAGIGLLFTASLTYAVTDSFAGPLADLLAGAERAVAGDLTTPVRVTTADETGELAGSFNEMLVALREREALRRRGDALNRELGLALERVRSSQTRLVSAADSERRRMERDLHDGAQQSLVILSLKLRQLESMIKLDPAAAERLIGDLEGDARSAVEQLRDLAHGLYPQVLVTGGLPAAVRDLVSQASIPTTLSCDGVGRMHPDVEVAVYFCCSESLTNAAKHAGKGASASVTLLQFGGVLSFEVRDDGGGFAFEKHRRTGGLQNMIDRLAAVGGQFEVRSDSGHGTSVKGAVPLSSMPLSGDLDFRSHPELI